MIANPQKFQTFQDISPITSVRLLFPRRDIESLFGGFKYHQDTLGNSNHANFFLCPHRQQYPIATPSHAQTNFIFKMKVTKITGQPWIPNSIVGVIKRTYYYFSQIHTSQICTFWTNIQDYHLKRSIKRTWNIFHFFLYVIIFHLLWRQKGVGICWNHIHTGLPWLSRFTNGIE